MKTEKEILEMLDHIFKEIKAAKGDSIAFARLHGQFDILEWVLKKSIIDEDKK